MFPKAFPAPGVITLGIQNPCEFPGWKSEVLGRWWDIYQNPYGFIQLKTIPWDCKVCEGKKKEFYLG